MELYGINTNKQLTKTGKLFKKLYEGTHLTSASANSEIRSTEGARFIRFIRQDGHPVQVRPHRTESGSRFLEYFFEDSYREEIRKAINNA